MKIAKNGFLTLAVLVLLASGISGCNGESAATSDKPRFYTSNPNLTHVTSCDEVATYYKETSKVAIRKTFENNRTWYGTGGYGGGAGGGDMGTEATADGATSGAEASSGSTPEFSETNIQEAGVDEADIVKTDGNHIYVLNGKYFIILKSWLAADEPAGPGPVLTQLSQTTLDGDATELFIANNKAVIILSVSSSTITDTAIAALPATYYGMVQIVIYDITDRTNPVLERKTYIDGWYMTSRRIGDMVYIASNSYFNTITPYELLDTDEFKNTSYDLVYQGNRDLEEDMIDYVEQMDMEAYLPKAYDKIYTAGDTSPDFTTVSQCDNFYFPETPNAYNVMNLYTYNLTDTAAPLESTAITANYGNVYASQGNLYLAAQNYRYWYWYEWNADEGWTEKTYLYKFTLGTEPRYVACGEVDGYVINQFAMSEYNGYFRIATSESPLNSGDSTTRSNNIFILQQDGDKLQKTGSIENIAQGEQLQAARFMGNKGYIVTFMQTDPLFTMDLTDPANPELKGELVMPGYSTYLHPVGADNLLGIGYSADSMGRINGMQLSLYDIADLANPVQVANTAIGSGWDTWSEAMYNHKAFQFYEPLGILSIPVYHWSWGVSGDALFNGAMVFKIDASQGANAITELGEINHDMFYTPSGKWYWNYNREVRRSMFIGTAETGYYLYTISGVGIQVNPVDALTTVTANLSLPNDWVDVYCCLDY